MNGIERLRGTASALGDYARGETLSSWLSDIADQRERERAEDAEAVAWVRECGGLEAVKSLLGWVVGHCSTSQQLDFDFWLSGRVMHELGFEEDVADRDEVERRLLARLMPEGGWPRFEDGKPVFVGSDFADKFGEAHTVTSIEFFEGHVELHWNLDEPGEFEWLHPGERVKRPTPKVTDADGAEIREKCDVWWICEGDERGVHAERLRVETICPNGLIECSPYNGGTWVYLEPSELYVNKPVPASDGKPLREGETAYLVGFGTPVEVRTIFSDYVVDCVKPDTGEDAGHLAARDLTHERPDSWERLEEDATRNPFDYCKDAGIDVPDPRDGIFISDVIEPFAKDLVRRAKALAERDA